MNTIRRSYIKLLSAAAAIGVLYSPAIGSTKEAMDEQTFWRIVEAAKTSASANLDARPQALEAQLSPLDLESLGAFQRTYEGFLLRANRWDLWGAAYLMNGGCSDDGFKYFRDWLISEGRSTYEQALTNPESLASFPVREYFELELFGYAASKVFARKGGGELDRDFNVELAVPVGKEWKESDLPAMFPKLAAKFLAK
jgi:Protein of unknown function (DUF4240)